MRHAITASSTKALPTVSPTSRAVAVASSSVVAAPPALPLRLFNITARPPHHRFSTLFRSNAIAPLMIASAASNTRIAAEVRSSKARSGLSAHK